MALLIFWWMLLVWAVIIAAYFAIRYWLARRHKGLLSPTDVPVAHTVNLTGLPQYMAALKKYQILLYVTTGLLGLAVAAAILMTARPSVLSSVRPVQKNRDIMLCLDASGSVLNTDTALINRFSAVVNDFQGQRFGLTLFNSSAVSIIPLNDNYNLTSKQLSSTGKAFKSQSGDMFDTLTKGTLVGFQSGTSLASDGLASCIQNLGSSGQQRSKSIILATDNEVNGTPVVGMTQAMALAKQQNIHVFIIDPGVRDTALAGDHEQLKVVGRQTDGGYYQLSESNTVPSIVDAISKQTAKDYTGVAQPAINDRPQPLLYTAIIVSAVAMLLLWRLEL